MRDAIACAGARLLASLQMRHAELPKLDSDEPLADPDSARRTRLAPARPRGVGSARCSWRVISALPPARARASRRCWRCAPWCCSASDSPCWPRSRRCSIVHTGLRELRQRHAVRHSRARARRSSDGPARTAAPATPAPARRCSEQRIRTSRSSRPATRTCCANLCVRRRRRADASIADGSEAPPRGAVGPTTARRRVRRLDRRPSVPA